MAERILELAAAVAIELVGDGPQHLQPFPLGAAGEIIDVGDIEMDQHGVPPIEWGDSAS